MIEKKKKVNVLLHNMEGALASLETAYWTSSKVKKDSEKESLDELFKLAANRIREAKKEVSTILQSWGENEGK